VEAQETADGRGRILVPKLSEYYQVTEDTPAEQSYLHGTTIIEVSKESHSFSMYQNFVF
jgi:hypothetical protein